MKKIVLSADSYPSIYVVPDDVADNLRSHINDFYKWLYERKNNHGYWKDLGGIEGVCYTEEAFISWLNAFVIKTSEKAALVETKKNDNLSEEEQTYPDYNF